MPKNQHKRGGIVVDDRGRFGCAQNRETLLEVSSSVAPRAVDQAVFKVVIVRADSRQCLDDGMPERRAAEIRVHQNSRAINKRLDARSAKFAERGANAGEYCVKAGNR